MATMYEMWTTEPGWSGLREGATQSVTELHLDAFIRSCGLADRDGALLGHEPTGAYATQRAAVRTLAGHIAPLIGKSNLDDVVAQFISPGSVWLGAFELAHEIAARARLLDTPT